MEPAKPGDKRLLVVDDSIIMQKMLRINFSRPGTWVLTTAHPVDALALAKKHKPHLIVTDLNMPEMRGMDFLRLLKQSDELKNIPVVVYTSNLDDQMEAEALALGAARYIVKPIKPEPLKKMIMDQLHQSPLYLAEHPAG